MERIQYKGQQLLPVKKDLVFKAVFIGDGDLELLASLLSSILELDITAQDVAVTNTELPPIHEFGKLSRMDIRVKTADNKHINVEIQLKDEHNIEKRSLYYLAKLYTEQMTQKMRFEDICSTIAINILDFDFLPFAEYHNKYRMKHTNKDHELTDVFEINFLELKKIPNEITENLKDAWMLYLSTDKAEVLEMLSEQNPVFQKAVNKLVYVSADEQLRYELDMREKAELDYSSAMHTNFRKGAEEATIEIAKEMLQDGDSVEKISRITKLPKEIIARLQINE